ncbi:MAG: hypothetical protein MR844_03125 [Clostridia bacterium]|nr:hypothetical protein [Clostridia bacterium]
MRKIRTVLALICVLSLGLAFTFYGRADKVNAADADESRLKSLFVVTDGKNAIEKADVFFAEAELRTSAHNEISVDGNTVSRLSTQGQKKVGGVYIDRVTTGGTAATNEIMQVEYAKTLNLTDNDFSIPLIKFAVPVDGNESFSYAYDKKVFNTRNFDVADITVRDAVDSEKYFVITIYQQSNYTETQIGCSYVFVRTSAMNEGKVDVYRFVNGASFSTEYNNREFSFYYDYSENKLKVGDYNDSKKEVFDLNAMGISAIDSAKITVRTIKNLKNQNSYTDIYGKSTVLNNFNTLTKSALKTDKSAKIIITDIDGTNFAPTGGKRETVLTKDGAYIKAAVTGDEYLRGAVKRLPQPDNAPDGYVVYDNYVLLTRMKGAMVYIPDSSEGVDTENYFYNSASEYFEVTDGNFANDTAILSSINGSAEYSGIGFKLNNGAKIAYKGKVNLADKSAADKLIELFVTPEETKSGGEEFSAIKIKFYDLHDGRNCINLLISQANDKQFTKITAYASWYDEQNGQTVTQNPLGYFLAIDKYSVDFPSQATQSLYGKPVGSNGYLPITFYYESATKKLYATPVADKNNAKTKGLIRDFSLNETQMPIRESKVACVDGVWQGFSSDEVGVEISAQTVGGKVGNLSVLSIGDVDFGAPHTVKPLITGIKDIYYPLPLITDCYDPSTRVRVAMEDVSLVRRVFYVSDGTEYEVENGKFLPDKAGEYRCEYYAATGDKTYRTDAIIKIDDASVAPALELNVSDYNKKYYGDCVLDVSATSGSGIYLGNTHLNATLKIYKDGEFVCDYDFAVDGEKAFDEGVYKLEWTTSDALGRVVVKTVNFAVVYSDIRFADGIDEISTVDKNSEISVTAADVTVWDYQSEGGRPYSSDIVIEISENGSEFKKYNGEKLSVGEYEIRYTATYEAVEGSVKKTLSITRKITVKDLTEPVFAFSKQVSGLYENTDKTADGVYFYKAIKGKNFSVRGVTASDDGSDLTDGIKYSLIRNASVVADETPYDKNVGVTVLPDENGTYILKFTVSDGVNESLMYISVEVKDVWLTVEINDVQTTAEVGEEVDLNNSFTVKNIDGSSASGYIVKITCKTDGNTEQSAAGGKFTPVFVGTYTVTIAAGIDGDTAYAVTQIEVKDTTAPVIGEVVLPEKATKGETVILPDPEIKDNYDLAPELRVFVEYGGERKRIVNGNFVPDKSGEWYVIYEAEDGSGNVGVSKKYKITVTDNSEQPSGESGQSGKGCNGRLAVESSLAVLGIAFAAAILLQKFKKEGK